MTETAPPAPPARSRDIWARLAPLAAGPLLAAAWYAVVLLAPLPLLDRYFLGHPISVVITVLFCIAVAALLGRLRAARYEQWILASLAPGDLRPRQLSGTTVEARVSGWTEHLDRLHTEIRRSRVAARFRALLLRQQRRGHARHLADDLRELSDRDSDADYDRLQLVRIIVWAIPMLGFLGTVIGITQTLGGLDFSEAEAAMDRLKAGLYVAFDTTALGLVLSVLVIFLQYPLEQRQQRVLQQIDDLAGQLLPGSLPETTGGETPDPLATLGEMTEGLLAAVRESVETQATLWRSTVDAAQGHWQTVVGTAGDQVQAALTEAIDASLDKHARYLQQVQQDGAEAIDSRWHQWQTALSDNARILSAHQKALVRQNELLGEAAGRAEELAALRQSLDANLRGVAGAEGLADAMRTLARAVDVLAARVPPATSESIETRRRAA